MSTPASTTSTTDTPATASSDTTIPGITFLFRLLDIQGNTITLGPDMDTAAGDLRIEGGIRLTGDHRSEAFQAFARALAAAGGPYSGTPAAVRGALEVPLLTVTPPTTPTETPAPTIVLTAPAATPAFTETTAETESTTETTTTTTADAPADAPSDAPADAQ